MFVETETPHLDRPGQLGDSEKERNTNSQSARCRDTLRAFYSGDAAFQDGTAGKASPLSHKLRVLAPTNPHTSRAGETAASLL